LLWYFFTWSFVMAKSDNTKGKVGAERGLLGGLSLDSLIKTLPGLASQTFARAAGQSGNLLDMLLKAPEYMEQVGKAGGYLKDMRQVAGLTLDDLAKAVDIDNPDILRAVEEGRSPITLDILFRLGSFYSRNDPFSFVVNFSREYAPWLWQILRITGIEKMLITLEREIKFINIYRSRESARHLSDANYDRLLDFVRQSFSLAMDFIEPLETQGKGTATKAAKGKQPPSAAEPASPPKPAPARQPAKSRTAKKAGTPQPPRPKTAPARKPVRKSPAAAKSRPVSNS